jgi:hypothetical protein
MSIEPVKSTFSKVRNLHLFPLELRNQNIWLIAANEEGLPEGKIPHVATDSGLLQRFSQHHKPMSFIEANVFHEKYGYDIGILISADDHTTVIDLDGKGVSESEYNKRLTYFKQIIDSAQCYAELSQSEKGFHIICKSEHLIANNFQKFGVEIYSYRNRFMVCTGNRVSVLNDAIYHDFKDSHNEALLKSNNPIEYRNELVSDLRDQLQSADVNFKENGIILCEVDPIKTNDEILNSIFESGLVDIFSDLLSFTVNTDYEKTKYPSGSEAALSAIGLICKFTDSNEQVRCIFRTLGLAQRDKYTKNNYHIDRCLTIARSEQDLSEVDTFIASAVSLYQKNQQEILDRRIAAESHILNEATNEDHVSNELQLVASEYEAEIEDFTDIDLPPGLAGDIAQFSLDSSPHKLKVAAIAASLASIGGLVGRQYRYKGSSLGNYFVVIGFSTMGKESASTTLSAIAKAIAVSGGDAFFSFDKLASGAGLRTLMSNAEYGSLCASFPEFALFIEQLKASKGNSNGAMAGMFSELLDLKTKDKKGSRYGATAHANKDNNRIGIEAPSFTFVGDCTPNFYEGISEEMLSSGFMSRLILLSDDNTFKKPFDRNAHLVTLSKETVSRLNMLVQQVTSKFKDDIFIPVELANPIVEREVDKLEEYLNLKFNKSHNEAYRQVYGRAFLKVMTIAASLAATENLGNPLITLTEFYWARNFIMRDIFITVDKLNKGEIGVSEENCKRRVSALFDKLLKHPKQRDKLAKGYAHVLDLGVLPRSLLSQRLQGNSFRIGQMSNTKTLEAVIDNMIKNGEIKVVGDEKKTILTNYTGRSVRGVCYASTDAYFDTTLNVVADWLKEAGRETLIQYL